MPVNLYFSRFKAVLFGLLFTSVTLKSEDDFLSLVLSGERTSFLPLNFHYFQN